MEYHSNTMSVYETDNDIWKLSNGRYDNIDNVTLKIKKEDEADTVNPNSNMEYHSDKVSSVGETDNDFLITDHFTVKFKKEDEADIDDCKSTNDRNDHLLFQNSYMEYHSDKTSVGETDYDNWKLSNERYHDIDVTLPIKKENEADNDNRKLTNDSNDYHLLQNSNMSYHSDKMSIGETDNGNWKLSNEQYDDINYFTIKIKKEDEADNDNHKLTNDGNDHHLFQNYNMEYNSDKMSVSETDNDNWKLSNNRNDNINYVSLKIKEENEEDAADNDNRKLPNDNLVLKVEQEEYQLQTQHFKEQDDRNDNDSDVSYDNNYDEDDDYNNIKSRKKWNRHNLNLAQRLQVIEAYNQKQSIRKISKIYNCSISQIRNIVKKRDEIQKFYKGINNCDNVGDDDDDNAEIDSDNDSDDEFKHDIDYQTKLNLEQRITELDSHLNVSQLSYTKLTNDDNIELRQDKNYIHTNFSQNKFDLKKCVQVIKAYDRKVSCINLSRKYKCSYGQIRNIIRNRDLIIKDYGLHTSHNDDDGEKNTNVSLNNSTNKLSHAIKTKSPNKLNFRERVKVIKSYDRKISLYKLSRIFNCTFPQIKNIIHDRDTILKLYYGENNNLESSNSDSENEKSLNDITNYENNFHLEKSVQLIEAYNRKLSYHKLSRMFNFNWGQIDNILLNRSAILKAYKEINGDDGNDLSLSNNSEIVYIKPTKLNLVDRVRVIEAYDRKLSRNELIEMFNCDYRQISNIVKNRIAILKAYEEQKNPNNISKDFNDHDTIENSSLNKIQKKKNKLNLAESFRLIKAFDRKISICQLSRVFNCHRTQVYSILKKRDEILNDYEKHLSGGIDKNDSSNSDNEKSLNYTGESKLNLKERVQLIKDYEERRFSYYKLSGMFNCNWGEIDHVIKNRRQILKDYEKEQNMADNDKSESLNNHHQQRSDKKYYHKLNLDERVRVIKSYDHNLSLNKLSRIFNCTTGQISNIVNNRIQILNDYEKINIDKKQSSNSDNEKSLDDSENRQNNLSLEERVNLIEAYSTRKLSYCKLEEIFNCNWGQIDNILSNRQVILKEYKKKELNKDVEVDVPL